MARHVVLYQMGLMPAVRPRSTVAARFTQATTGDRTVSRSFCLSVLAAIALFFLTVAGSAQTLTFPTLTGRVVDEAGMLNAADRAALTESLTGLEAKTTDQLVVVTLKSLQGTSIEDYGYQLGRRWKIGQKDKDSGVMLIVAANERAVRIEVGYGLEGTLTDAMTKVIIESSILPLFKAGDFSGGIKRGAADIIKLLGGDAEGFKSGAGPPTPSDIRASPKDKAPAWPLIVLGVTGVGLLIFCAVTKGGGLCQWILQIILMMLIFGGGGRSSRGGTSMSGGGGSFGGGGSSGKW